ncbi:hypothetical protein LXA43DRAFT_1182999 [Ganoderma leucocontextum]|nr:hypothetical protein LXA43DRAFT_1182999 [Ganoderma leucocontextum]
MSSGQSLSRRSSLVDYISQIPRPRLASLRSRKSTVSLKSTASTKVDNYTPYAVHQQKMKPIILRDADATQKLLEAILETPQGRRSVSRLARTCNGLQGAGFERPLARSRQPHSTPRPGMGLVRLLSQSAPQASLLTQLFTSVAPPSLLSSISEQTKAPERDDWARVLAYGMRVKSIGYVEMSGNIAPSILPLLEEHRPAIFILPNLTSLTWKVETAANLERCRMFLAPFIESVQLEVGSKSPRIDDILEEIASHKGLKSFSFTLHTNLPDKFTETFQDNVKLEKLALTAPGALAARVGKWASGLPLLKTLGVDLSARSTTAVEGFFDDISPGSGYSTPSSVGGTDSGVFSADEADFSEARKAAVRLTRDGPRRGAFAKLSNLTLTGEAANLTMFLKHLTSPLNQLDLVMEDPPMPLDWHSLCVVVSDQFADTLQSLRISATSASRFGELVRATSRGGDAPMHHLPLTYFSMLPRLWRFEVDLPESVIFEEKDLKHIARICPNIEILRLSPNARFPSTGPPPSITLESTVPLTRDCRWLHTLAVVMNAAELSSDDVYSTRVVCSRSLLRLHVGHSWVKNPLQTAVLLSHLTPYLETLKYFEPKSRAGAVEANSSAWQRVAEILPHVQHIRLSERKLQPPPAPYVPPPKSDKAIDATPIMFDAAVSVRPQVQEISIQAVPEVVDSGVQIMPETTEVSIDATPVLVEAEVMAVPEYSEASIDAIPPTEEKGTEPWEPDTESEASSDGVEYPVPPISMFTPTAVVSGAVYITHRVFRFYTAPIRFVFSFMPTMPMPMPILSKFALHAIPSSELELNEKQALLAANAELQPRASAHAHANGTAVHAEINPDSAVANDNIIIASPETVAVTSESSPAAACLPQFAEDTTVEDVQALESFRFQFGTSVPVRAPFRVTECQKQDGERLYATRQSSLRTATSAWLASSTTSPTYIMADPKKQEKDFTKEVDELLPQVQSLAQSGKLQESLDKIYVLEKQTRNASDMNSTTRLVKEASELCYKAGKLELLNSNINTLSKKHGQLKAVIQALVEQAIGWLEEIRKSTGTEKWLQLIETLRNVTEGKIFLETPRARITLLLAQYHETLTAAASATPASRKEALQLASDLLSDLQVETYSSMDRREKTEFLLEQMRLLIAFARLKDAEIGGEGKDSIAGGEAEWVKVRVGGRKVNEEFLKNKENEDLKLKYYDMMIQYALYQSAYLDAAKYYHKVWETPSIKEEVNGRGREALEHIVYYVVLAPHDNEQSDMLHRLFNDPALPKLELNYALVKCFTTPELMRWPGIEQIYGPHLKKTSVFSSPKLWEDLHTRVIEHNIRIVSQYYTRITLIRLTSLLDLTQQQTEETLCRLVVSGTVWARIDRPASIVNFRQSRGAEDVMNDWSSDMQRLLGLVEKTWMGVNAAQAAQSRAVKAAS